MVMISMLAGASAILHFVAVPGAQHLCAAQSIVVPVSTTPVPKNAGQADGRLPDIGPKSRDPAVLLPECKATPRQKRKRRLSDYPMA